MMERGSVAALAERFADAEILVNNAGATPTGPIEEATEDKWREGLELKVIATALLTRELYLRMCARKRGVIVNVTGNCGAGPDPPRASYVSGTVLTVDGGVSARGHLF